MSILKMTLPSIILTVARMSCLFLATTICTHISPPARGHYTHQARIKLWPIYGGVRRTCINGNCGLTRQDLAAVGPALLGGTKEGEGHGQKP